MAHRAAIDTFRNAIVAAAIPACGAWSADATPDATVPNWRFRVSGAGLSPRRPAGGGKS